MRRRPSRSKPFVSILIIGLLVFLSFKMYQYFALRQTYYSQIKPTVIPTQTPTPTIAQQPLKKSVFVPYWTDFSQASDLNQYDRLIYFGITPTNDGINQTEPGYTNIPDFIAAAGTQEKWLTLRMTDSAANVPLLRSQANWQKIAEETAATVQENKFDGLVIDLELSSLVLEDLSENISGFIQTIANAAKDKDIKVGIAMYGDVFYRKRQFDVAKLAKFGDEMLIMAYDLHKASGEPGPNFPLAGADKFGYDFTTMIKEYLQFVPAEKLSVVFGRYGYDWVVDELKRPIKPATSVTDAQVQKKFIDSCSSKNCVVKRDRFAAETEVNYIDDALNYHVVWFEDQESVNRKLEFLKTQGIFSYSYWAYSYF